MTQSYLLSMIDTLEIISSINTSWFTSNSIITNFHCHLLLFLLLLIKRIYFRFWCIWGLIILQCLMLNFRIYILVFVLLFSIISILWWLIVIMKVYFLQMNNVLLRCRIVIWLLKLLLVIWLITMMLYTFIYIIHKVIYIIKVFIIFIFWVIMLYIFGRQLIFPLKSPWMIMILLLLLWLFGTTITTIFILAYCIIAVHI